MSGSDRAALWVHALKGETVMRLSGCHESTWWRVPAWVAVCLGGVTGACATPSTEDGDDEKSTCVHVTSSEPERSDSDTLPSGSCVPDPAEPVCHQIVRPVCPCGEPGPRSPYDCRCLDGYWSCEQKEPDARSCRQDCSTPEARHTP